MKKLFLFIFLFLITLISYSQFHLWKGEDQKITLNWDKVSIDSNDSLKFELAKTNSSLKGMLERSSEYFASKMIVCNLDNNMLGDMLFYWPDNSNEPILEIYQNINGNLELIKELRGHLTFIDKNYMNGNIEFSIDECRYSVYPYLKEYHFITITNFLNKLEVYDNSVLYFAGTEFPEKLLISEPFEIIKPKYRLRLTPEIKEENVICELTNGDKGIALAKKTDKTGRIWWFVKVENNIDKDINEFFFIDKGSPKNFKKPIYGWISSRFLKTTIK